MQAGPAEVVQRQTECLSGSTCVHWGDVAAEEPSAVPADKEVLVIGELLQRQHGLQGATCRALIPKPLKSREVQNSSDSATCLHCRQVAPAEHNASLSSFSNNSFNDMV